MVKDLRGRTQKRKEVEEGPLKLDRLDAWENMDRIRGLVRRCTDKERHGKEMKSNTQTNMEILKSFRDWSDAVRQTEEPLTKEGRLSHAQRLTIDIGIRVFNLYI